LPNAWLGHLTHWFVRNIREDEGIISKLLDVVKHVSDKVHGDLVNLVHPLLDDLENVFARVGGADVGDDVLGIAVVNFEHLYGLFFVFDLFL
jgi:hypothetical protein